MNKPRSTTVLMPLSESTKLDFDTHNFLSELSDLFAQAGVEFGQLVCPGLDQAQARAELGAAWYYLDHTEDALLLDSDMSADARLVFEQLAVLEEPVLVCPYLQRNEQGLSHGLSRWTLDAAGQRMELEMREGRRMMRMPASGLGFTRIRRSAWKQAIEHFNPEAFPLLNWRSHLPNHAGLTVCGLFEPLVHDHLGDGVMKRRSEDVSFFVRLAQAGLTPYALLDSVVTHHGKCEGSFLDALKEDQRQLESKRRHIAMDLLECPDDLLGLQDVLDGAYEIAGLELERPRVLDLGANVGAFACWAMRRWHGAQILCYEPHPNMARLCRHNVESRSPVIDPPLVTQAAIVGADFQGETVRLYDAAAGVNQGCRSIHPQMVQQAESFTEVPALKANALPPCDVLKVDTEGAERAILESYPHLDGCSAVLTEWHSGEDYLWLRGFLKSKGFDCAIDRARGRPSAHRELCFVRRGLLEQLAKQKTNGGPLGKAPPAFAPQRLVHSPTE